MHRNRTFAGLFGVASALVALPLPVHAAGMGVYLEDIRRWFGDGGNTMWFILACSILSVAFTVERLLRMRRSRIVPKELAPRVRQLWQEGKQEEILRVCEADDSVLAHAIQRMVRHRQVPLADLRMIVGDSISAEIGLFYRRIHPISVSATVAPLLGLFGTVSGMITAFRQFRALGETGDPGVFAGAISIALITTQAGLVVGIPSLLAWHYLRNLTNSYVDELEGIVQELMLEWYLNPVGAPVADTSR